MAADLPQPVNRQDVYLAAIVGELRELRAEVRGLTGQPAAPVAEPAPAKAAAAAPKKATKTTRARKGTAVTGQ